jgi:uncharacterized membrane protein YjjP (DUF1212 family)
LPTGPADPDFGHVYRFIITLGEAAHGYGSTATRLEEFLSRLTETFGYSGVFRSTPTEIVFAIQQGPGQPQRVHSRPSRARRSGPGQAGAAGGIGGRGDRA